MPNSRVVGQVWNLMRPSWQLGVAPGDSGLRPMASHKDSWCLTMSRTMGTLSRSKHPWQNRRIDKSVGCPDSHLQRAKMGEDRTAICGAVVESCDADRNKLPKTQSKSAMPVQ